MSQLVCLNCCRSNMSQNEKQHDHIHEPANSLWPFWDVLERYTTGESNRSSNVGFFWRYCSWFRNPAITSWLFHRVTLNQMNMCSSHCDCAADAASFILSHVTDVIMSKLSCEKLTKKGNPIALQQSTCFSPPHVVRCCAPDWRVQLVLRALASWDPGRVDGRIQKSLKAQIFRWWS